MRTSLWTESRSSLNKETYFRSFRLQSKRFLKELMMNIAGCNQRSAGIGDIAYVKDHLIEKIVTTKLRCFKFGLAHHRLAKIGWVRNLNMSRYY